MYFYVPLDHAWKVPVLQELLNTRTNNLYIEGFDDYVITEMINMLCNVVYLCIILHIFLFSFVKLYMQNIQTKELSLWHKLRFSNTYIFATQCRRP